MMREKLDKNLVEQYKEIFDFLPPVMVFETPRGLLLVDGFHRHAAARQLNRKMMEVVVAKGSVQDALGSACLANLRHGKALTRDEKKKAIYQYIKLNSKLSNVLIGEHVGKDEKTIRLYRDELIDKGDLKPATVITGKDGRETDISKIGKTTSENSEVDSFDEWFAEHVTMGDVLDVLEKDQMKYDLAIIDPPYGILKEQWDKRTKFELITFTRKWLNLVLQRLKPSARIFLFWSREYLFDLKPLLDDIKNEYPLNFGGLIVWNFRNVLTVPNNRKELKITWEPIFYFYGLEAQELNRPDQEITGQKWENIDSDVWTYDSDVLTYALPQSNFTDKKIHPAQKPLGLYKHIIELATNPTDRILDPFAGSGTTGHAAYDLGREFRLIEKEPSYINAMRERLKGVFHNGK